MLEMSVLGAKMHPRSIELASQYKVPKYVCGTFSSKSGTLITGGNKMEKNKKITGIAIDKNVAKISIKKIKDQPGIVARILEPLSAKSISVDVIVQNTPDKGYIDFSFSLSEDDLDFAHEILINEKKLDYDSIVKASGLSKISLVGSGMQNESGYASTMFKVLGDQHVSIDMITTSEIRITCLINQKDTSVAVNALHSVFELDK